MIGGLQTIHQSTEAVILLAFAGLIVLLLLIAFLYVVGMVLHVYCREAKTGLFSSKQRAEEHIVTIPLPDTMFSEDRCWRVLTWPHQHLLFIIRMHRVTGRLRLCPRQSWGLAPKKSPTVAASGRVRTYFRPPSTDATPAVSPSPSFKSTFDITPSRLRPPSAKVLSPNGSPTASPSSSFKKSPPVSPLGLRAGSKASQEPAPGQADITGETASCVMATTEDEESEEMGPATSPAPSEEQEATIPPHAHVFRLAKELGVDVTVTRASITAPSPPAMRRPSLTPPVLRRALSGNVGGGSPSTSPSSSFKKKHTPASSPVGLRAGATLPPLAPERNSSSRQLSSPKAPSRLRRGTFGSVPDSGLVSH